MMISRRFYSVTAKIPVNNENISGSFPFPAYILTNGSNSEKIEAVSEHSERYYGEIRDEKII